MGKQNFLPNRAQRRAIEKARPGWMPGSRDERLKALMKNGITPEYVQAEKEKSYREGFLSAGTEIVKGCYAAVCLALNEEYGFGPVRCKRVIEAVDQHLSMTLTATDLIDETLEKMGIKIVFTEGVNRVQ